MTDRLSDELAQQLRSLDDLDAEHAAGDLQDDDYRKLHDLYTVRVADTVRRIEHASGERDEPVPVRSTRRVNLAIVAGIAVFAVAAGWLLARSTGERGVGDILTGSIDSSRQRIFDCQELAADDQIVESLQCLDEVLLDDPDNAEALTYRGWYLVLTTSSAEAAGDQDQAVELLDTGLTYLDRAVEVDPGFVDARAFRAVVYDRRGDTNAVCQELAELLALDPPPFFVEQTADLTRRNGCEG